MSITREQFLAGVIFSYKGIKYHRFQFSPNADGDSQPGYLREFNGTRFQWAEHHANVDKVEKTRFRAYTTLVGKCIHRWCYFEDMVIIDEPKPAENGSETTI